MSAVGAVVAGWSTLLALPPSTCMRIRVGPHLHGHRHWGRGRRLRRTSKPLQPSIEFAQLAVDMRVSTNVFVVPH